MKYVSYFKFHAENKIPIAPNVFLYKVLAKKPNKYSTNHATNNSRSNN